MADIVSTVAWIVLAAVVLALIVYITAKVVEYRNPPIGNFVKVDGTTLHYVERGSGSPVLFLHGNAMVVAAGFSGHGYKFCSGIGEILADLVMYGATSHDTRLFSLSRPALAMPPSC